MPTQDTKMPVRKRGHLRGMAGDKAAAREEVKLNGGRPVEVWFELEG